MTKKRLNKTETANKIIQFARLSVQFNMNMKKFEKKRNDVDWLLKACQHVQCEPVYYQN